MSNVYVPQSLTPLNYQGGQLVWWTASGFAPTYQGVVVTVNNIGVVYNYWGGLQIDSASYTADQYGIILSADVTVGQQGELTYDFVQTSTFDSQNRIASNTLQTTAFTNYSSYSYANTEAS